MIGRLRGCQPLLGTGLGPLMLSLLRGIYQSWSPSIILGLGIQRSRFRKKLKRHTGSQVSGVRWELHCQMSTRCVGKAGKINKGKAKTTERGRIKKEGLDQIRGHCVSPLPVRYWANPITSSWLTSQSCVLRTSTSPWVLITPFYSRKKWSACLKYQPLLREPTYNQW